MGPQGWGPQEGLLPWEKPPRGRVTSPPRHPRLGPAALSSEKTSFFLRPRGGGAAPTEPVGSPSSEKHTERRHFADQ